MVDMDRACRRSTTGKRLVETLMRRFMVVQRVLYLARLARTRTPRTHRSRTASPRHQNMSDRLWTHFQQQLNIEPMDKMSEHDRQLASSHGTVHLLPNSGSLKRKQVDVASMCTEQIQTEIQSKEALLQQADLMARLPDGGRRIKEKLQALKQQLEASLHAEQPIPVHDFEEMSIKSTTADRLMDKEQRVFTQDPIISMITGKRNATPSSAKIIPLKESMQREGQHKRETDELRLAARRKTPNSVQELVQADRMETQEYRDFDELMDEGPIDD